MAEPVKLMSNMKITPDNFFDFVAQTHGKGPLRAAIKHDSQGDKVTVLHARTWGEFFFEKLISSKGQRDEARRNAALALERAMEGVGIAPDRRDSLKRSILLNAEKGGDDPLTASQVFPFERGRVSIGSMPVKNEEPATPASFRRDAHKLYGVPEGIDVQRARIGEVKADVVIVSATSLYGMGKEMRKDGTGRVLRQELQRQKDALMQKDASEFVFMPAGELPAQKILCAAGLRAEGALDKQRLKMMYLNMLGQCTGKVALEPIPDRMEARNGRLQGNVSKAGRQALREAIAEAREIAQTQGRKLSVAVITDDLEPWKKDWETTMQGQSAKAALQ